MAKMLTVSEILVRGRITAQDVEQLRGEAFAKGVASAEDAKALFELDAGCAKKDASWNGYFVAALTDYYVRRTEPKGGVSHDQAQHLIGNVLKDGRITRETELELLLGLIENAENSPSDLTHVALKAVWDSVTDPDSALYDRECTAAAIGAADVAVVRRAVGARADGAVQVSRPVAELLCDLNAATAGSANDAGWSPLFVESVAAHLIDPADGGVGRDAAEWLRGKIAQDGALDGNEKALLRFVHENASGTDPLLDPLFALAGVS